MVRLQDARTAFASLVSPQKAFASGLHSSWSKAMSPAFPLQPSLKSINFGLSSIDTHAPGCGAERGPPAGAAAYVSGSDAHSRRLPSCQLHGEHLPMRLC